MPSAFPALSIQMDHHLTILPPTTHVFHNALLGTFKTNNLKYAQFAQNLVFSAVSQFAQFVATATTIPCTSFIKVNASPPVLTQPSTISLIPQILNVLSAMFHALPVVF